jgi:hypothetical protein
VVGDEPSAAGRDSDDRSVCWVQQDELFSDLEAVYFAFGRACCEGLRQRAAGLECPVLDAERLVLAAAFRVRRAGVGVGNFEERSDFRSARLARLVTSL